jgi:hypothetical protein
MQKISGLNIYTLENAFEEKIFSSSDNWQAKQGSSYSTSLNLLVL